MPTRIEILRNQTGLLQSKEIKLWGKLNKHTAERNKILIEIYVLESGISLGDDVILKNGTKGKLIAWSIRYNSVFPKIRLYKKNGDLGKRTRELYHWDAPRKADK